MRVARIVKLPEHKTVIIGIDLDGIFKNGRIYEIREVLDGEFVIKDIGETALPKNGKEGYPNANSTVNAILDDCQTVFRTVEEYKGFIEYQKTKSDFLEYKRTNNQPKG